MESSRSHPTSSEDGTVAGSSRGAVSSAWRTSTGSAALVVPAAVDHALPVGDGRGGDAADQQQAERGGSYHGELPVHWSLPLGSTTTLVAESTSSRRGSTGRCGRPRCRPALRPATTGTSQPPNSGWSGCTSDPPPGTGEPEGGSLPWELPTGTIKKCAIPLRPRVRAGSLERFAQTMAAVSRD